MVQRNPCPNCNRELSPRVTARGNVRACEHGCGLCVTTSVLRRNTDDSVAADTWRVARASITKAVRRCPDCRREMRSVQLAPDAAALEIEACVPCMVLWFDQGEFGRLGGSFVDRKLPDPERLAAVTRAYAERGVPPPFDLDNAADAVLMLVDDVLAKWGWWWK